MPRRPVIVGVAGGSAAGKTTVARRLVAALPGTGVSLLEQDRYYRDRQDLAPEGRTRLNFDHPTALDLATLAEHVRALGAGHAVDVPRYDFARHLRAPGRDRIAPAALVIVEGHLVLADADLRRQLDVKVFVEADDRTRAARRLARDVAERGRTDASVRAQWTATVLPMHRTYVEPSRRHADVVVPGVGSPGAELAKLVALLEARLGSG